MNFKSWWESLWTEPEPEPVLIPKEPEPEPVIPTIPALNFPEGSARCRVSKFLHPLMRGRLESALDECHQQGLMVHVFESYRTPLRQKTLYGQGRTTPGRKVTNAKPYQSWHNFGLAFDLVFDGDARDGIQWSWEGDYNNDKLTGEKRSDYERVGVIFESHGFEWGARWRSFKEMPHFQMTFGLDRNKAKKILEDGGVEAVWLEVYRLS